MVYERYPIFQFWISYYEDIKLKKHDPIDIRNAKKENISHIVVSNAVSYI